MSDPCDVYIHEPANLIWRDMYIPCALPFYRIFVNSHGEI